MERRSTKMMKISLRYFNFFATFIVNVTSIFAWVQVQAACDFVIHYQEVSVYII